MKANLIKLLIALMVLTSCQKIERSNPFDPECPKQLWTPANLQAIQEGSTIKLTWDIPVTNLSGIKVFRQINHSGDFIEITDLKTDITQWIDNGIVGGKVHLYYLIAYAGENESNAVTAEITPILPPVISTATPSEVSYKSAVLGGNVISDGGSQVTEKGVCLSLMVNPTIDNTKIVISSGLGSFTQKITGLNTNTKYYVRAFAVNKQGISYGNELNFTTIGNSTVIDIDGNVYNTVTIGSQVWMVENLKTTKFRNGEPIPYWTKNVNKGYCWYNDEVNNKATYGAIYNYYTATDARNICPQGWHIPSNAEWTTLVNYLGGEGVAGGKLKEVGITHWASPNVGATNSYGFNALPGGVRDCSNNYLNINSSGSWWSSDKVSGGWVNGVHISSSSATFFKDSGYDCNASYVRCIKD